MLFYQQKMTCLEGINIPLNKSRKELHFYKQNVILIYLTHSVLQKQHL